MSRLEKAARDYAIALLAPTGDLYTLDALESVERLDGLECWAAVNRALGYLNVDDPHTHLRLVRARVALYLRTVRRMEAWERYGWGSWAAPGVRGCCWRPLYEDAPAHDPRVTAADRRGAR